MEKMCWISEREAEKTFFLMGLLAVIVIYLMERENGKKEAVKSVKMVLLVILFLLWLVLCPFIGMATLDRKSVV